MRDKKRRGREKKLWFTECTQTQVSDLLVRQKHSQWHRTWPACLKCSDQSGILTRNVFVRLASPRCRPHHTQQQAGQRRKHIKKNQPFEPLGLLIGFRELCSMTTLPGPKPSNSALLHNVTLHMSEHDDKKCAEHTSYQCTRSIRVSISFGIKQRPHWISASPSTATLCSRFAPEPELLALTDTNACIKKHWQSINKINISLWHAFPLSWHLQWGRIREGTVCAREKSRT